MLLDGTVLKLRTASYKERVLCTGLVLVKSFRDSGSKTDWRGVIRLLS